jgi:hypothetical protein
MAAMSILRLVVTFLGSLFKSQRQLAFENLALRQQVTMLRQSVKRPRATLHALYPDTVVRWHRQGFTIVTRELLHRSCGSMSDSKPTIVFSGGTGINTNQKISVV